MSWKHWLGRREGPRISQPPRASSCPGSLPRAATFTGSPSLKFKFLALDAAPSLALADQAGGLSLDSFPHPESANPTHSANPPSSNAQNGPPPAPVLCPRGSSLPAPETAGSQGFHPRQEALAEAVAGGAMVSRETLSEAVAGVGGGRCCHFPTCSPSPPPGAQEGTAHSCLSLSSLPHAPSFFRWTDPFELGLDAASFRKPSWVPPLQGPRHTVGVSESSRTACTVRAWGLNPSAVTCWLRDLG